MAKSQYSENLDLVQTQVTGLLRGLGFKKSARTYNRSAADGLVHVVNLQAGAYEFGEEIPGLRPNLWGRFTVNLGVYVPELDPDPRPTPRRSVPVYLCTIRNRLGPLLEHGKDLWWSLGGNWADSAADVVTLLEERGIPFLERYASAQDVIDRWVPDSEALELSLIARLDVARLLLARGDTLRGGELFREHYRRSAAHAPHRDYLRTLADALDVSLEDVE